MIGRTPGEWTTGERNWSSRVMALSRFDKTLVEIGHFSGNGRDEDEANARLAAAAPDLLEALEAVLAHVEDEDAPRVGAQCTLCKTYRDLIRFVIEKAKG